MSVNKVQLANGETIIDISDSTVTPETLAEGVTAHDASGQKITGKMIPGGGSSVQADWNQMDETAADFIKNKPFGESSEYGDTLTWDGNVNGLLSVQDLAYKISDAIPTKEDCANGGHITIVGGSYAVDADATGEELQSLFADDGSLNFSFIFLVVPYAGWELDGVAFPEPGVYATLMFGSVFTSWTINGYSDFISTQVKRIDTKYLPDTQAVFYSMGSDRYLYKDIGLTTKATRGDLVAASKKQIAISLGGYVFFFVVTVDAQQDWAFAYIQVPTEEGDLSVDRYYTAEYTES